MAQLQLFLSQPLTSFRHDFPVAVTLQTPIQVVFQGSIALSVGTGSSEK